MYNFLIKKNQEIVQVKGLFPLSSLLLDAYSVNFRYFGSPGNSSRHSTHNGAHYFEKVDVCSWKCLWKYPIKTNECIMSFRQVVKYQNWGWFWFLVSDTSVTTSKILWTTKELSEMTKNFKTLPPNAKVGCNSKNNNNIKYYIITNIHYMEPSINNISNFFGFLTPPSPMLAVFLYYPSAILTNFWPLPPFNCRLRLLSIFNNNFDIWWPAKMSRYKQKEHEFLN